ncbi:MAG: tetratricopeptide repeat protein [Candidatus Eisenbacteria bacterium]
MRIRTLWPMAVCLAAAWSVAVSAPAVAKDKKKEAKVFDPKELCDRQYASGLEFKKNSRFIDAKDAFVAVTEACPDYLNAYLQLGNIALQLREYDDAVKHYDKALSLDPANAEVQEALAYAFTATGKLDEAEDKYLKLLESDPTRVGAIQNLAFNYEKQGKTTEAIELYSRAMEIDTTLVPSLEDKLSQLYLNQKEYLQALYYLQHMRERNPDDLEILRKIAYFHYKVKDYAGAIPLYQELIAKAGDSANALNDHKLIAFCLRKVENFQDAVEHYEFILAAEPSDMNNYYQFGNMLVDIGRLDRAEQIGRKGLAQNSGWGCLHYLLGEVMEKRAAAAQDAKNWDAGRDLYKKAQGEFQLAVGDSQCGGNAAKQVDRQAQLIDRLNKLQEKSEQSGD